MGVAERREKRRQMLRREVLDCALDLLREEGIASLTIRRIAKLVDYSPAALYEYFSSKDEIIAELRREVMEELLAEMKGAHGSFSNLMDRWWMFRMKPENDRVLRLKLPASSLNPPPSYIVEISQTIQSCLRALNYPGLDTDAKRADAVEILGALIEGLARTIAQQKGDKERANHLFATSLNTLLTGWKNTVSYESSSQ